ncbi:hypothetical protein VB638_22385, partial [Dolichospermum sp. UHCC 0684]|nr:hypothetical protein [Dolichospermum sp. UHCC 0684]
IAKNSSPNASPVQLSVVRCPLLLGRNIPPASCLLFPIPCSLIFPRIEKLLTERQIFFEIFS